MYNKTKLKVQCNRTLKVLARNLEMEKSPFQQECVQYV